MSNNLVPSLGESEPFRILAVDDSPIELKTLVTILSRKGYHVTEAVNGSAAVEHFYASPPDLVLLDVELPDMDGFEVCRQIKAHKEAADVPVLFLTAHSDRHLLLKGFEVGGVDYITKPYSMEEVLVRIRTQAQLRLMMRTVKHQNDNLEHLLEDRTKSLIRAERQAAFGQLVQGIVHNIKNPLTGIWGNLQLLERSLDKMQQDIAGQESIRCEDLHPLVERWVRYTQTIAKSSQRINDMVHSLMRKSQSDKSEQMIRSDLNALLRQEDEFLQADLRYKRLYLNEMVLQESPLTAQFVPSMISQVFQNLVGNALDAMYDTKEPTLTIASGGDDANVWFSVTDSGDGISEEMLPRIFEPFYTTKKKYTEAVSDEPIGTGLGLWMCQDIVNIHNGEITVSNIPQRGACFTVRLPRHAQAPDQEAND